MTDDSFTIHNATGPYKGIPGTHLTCYSNDDDFDMPFYQTNETNIEQFTTGSNEILDTTDWSSSDLPIPAS